MHAAKDPSACLKLRIIFGCILVIALLVRATRLLSLFPILVDESIYLRWAEIIHHQGQWFISLLDAKQPLSYWIYAVTRMLWSKDPLLGARMVSVVAGLLSTVLMYLLGRRLSGEWVGSTAALLYAVLPYAAFYDRIAYTDSLVNLSGLAIVYASLVHFQSAEPKWRSALAAGLALGAGFFAKSSVAMFAPAPAAACLLFHGRRWRSLATIYGVAAVFPLISAVSVPNAPTFSTSSLIVHREQFFTPWKILLQHPFIDAQINAGVLLGYFSSYLTVPILLLAVASIIYLSWRRPKIALLFATICLAPLLLQVFILEYFPSRYPFPHAWPCLLVVALAAGDFARGFRAPAVRALLALVLAAPLAAQSIGLIRDPDHHLYPADADQYLGSNPYAGWGVREAVTYLLDQSKNGPFVLLTDPYWGPPADAMFSYLNLTRGIRVHEAWWLQLSKTTPILPEGEMALMKSHYERVPGGSLDFRTIERVFYVTDTGYFSVTDVQKRQPGARLVASFKKPDGVDSVDVYRLK